MEKVEICCQRYRRGKKSPKDPKPSLCIRAACLSRTRRRAAGARTKPRSLVHNLRGATGGGLDAGIASQPAHSALSATFLNSGCPIMEVAPTALPPTPAKPLTFGRHCADKDQVLSRGLGVCPLRGFPNPRRAEESPPPPASGVLSGYAGQSFRSLIIGPGTTRETAARPGYCLAADAQGLAPLPTWTTLPVVQRLKHPADRRAPGITPVATDLPRLAGVVCLDSSHVGSPLRGGSSRHARASRPATVSRLAAHFGGQNVEASPLSFRR